ncbi:MAG TPA: patatin-like phospholipase family protein [Thermoleophilaceae bacterium]|jgi:NTE family protein
MPPDPFNIARGAGALANARRSLLPLPLVDRPGPIPRDLFPPPAQRPALTSGLGVAAATSGGAAVALTGTARAFEDAGVRPAAISVSSAAVLWGAMWAAGMSAEEMADYSLGWRPEAALGVQWTGLPRLAVSAVRGFGGLARGAALEQLFPRHVWHMEAGATEVPLHAIAYDLDRDRLVPLGSEATPELTLGELARVAITPPRRADAVRIEGRYYADGGALDPLAARAKLTASGIEDVVELPAGGGGFYDLFLDRRRWPDHIRDGYAVTRRRRSESPS